MSQWADANRVLASESSAEPGRWSTDLAPYQREPMDCLSDPAVTELNLMWSAQTGKSEIVLNGVAYFSEQDPCPQLLVQPTIEMAEAFSKDRVAPMIRLCHSLLDRFGDPTSRKTGNNLRHKQYPGGYLTLAGANSRASLASRPLRISWKDEVDRFPASAGAEGDPVKLADKRTASFHNRKMVNTSTPTIKDVSRIERLFESGDRRRYWVPCPHCGEYHLLKFENLKWSKRDDGSVDDAWFVCPACEERIDEGAKHRMIMLGEWRAEAPFRGIASFHIWEAYSPWRHWSEIASDFLEAKKSPETLQTFVNTSLGEAWEDRSAAVEAPDPNDRCEDYGAEVPDDALVLTAGVDVQDNRLEAVVYGWGDGEEAWAIDHVVIGGSTEGRRPWQALDALLSREFLRADGTPLTISAMCIDSGGHRTQQVYDFVKPRQIKRVWAVKGMAGDGRPIIMAPNKRKVGDSRIPVDLHTVGVDEAKATIYARLMEDGRFHFPIKAEFNQEFFNQLTSEKLVTKYRAGVAKREWVKKRGRNEVLDCTVYALAALKRLRPNFKALRRRGAADVSEHQSKEGASQRPRRRRSSFATSWR